MSFDLNPNNLGVRSEMINQSAWPPIWNWLCDWIGAPSAIRRRGCMNDGLSISPLVAERLAQIIEQHGGRLDSPRELHEHGRTLNEETRAERLTKFFRASGGFEIW